MAGNEVKSLHRHSSASYIAGRGRLMGLVVTHKTGTTGDIIVYDNTSASGDEILEVDETTTGTISINIPGDGILYFTGLYVSMPSNTSVTIFYQQG